MVSFKVFVKYAWILNLRLIILICLEVWTLKMKTLNHKILNTWVLNTKCECTFKGSVFGNKICLFITKHGNTSCYATICWRWISTWSSYIWNLMITSVACAIGPTFYHVLKWFFLPKPGFLEFIWIFSGRDHLKINICHILNPNLTK